MYRTKRESPPLKLNRLSHHMKNYILSTMEIESTAEILRKANYVVVLTGAGVSAESGIPTFRGENGLWRNYRAEELATPYAFTRNPQLVWEWYEWRRDIIRKAEPNPAHYAIKEMEEAIENFFLITQNVDNLHRKAGNRKLVEFHGNIFREKCTVCEFKRFHYEKHKTIPPECPKCGNLLRPDVVWFGEPIPPDIIEISQFHIQRTEVLLSIGTSAVVQPAASLISVAKGLHKTVIEVNLTPTPVSGFVDISIQGKAGEILPEIIKAVKR